MKYLAVLVLCAIAAEGCTKKIVRPGPEISFKNGRLLYKGEEFKGIVVEKFENVGTVRETHYRFGLPNGVQEERFDGGYQVVARGEYTNGLKTSVHEGWFPEGQRRFHYEYNDKGESHGDFWEWYVSGGVSLFARFDNGQLVGKKMWREDGKIYMNYVFQENQAFGTPGTKLCYQVRNGGI